MVRASRVHGVCMASAWCVHGECAHACMREASSSSARLLIWRRYSSSFSTWYKEMAGGVAEEWRGLAGGWHEGGNGLKGRATFLR